MGKLKNLPTLVKNALQTVKSNWKTAPQGKYVSYRELAAYSVGGAGVYFIISIVGMIVLNAGSMIVGASIGLKAVDLQTINVFSTLIILLFTPVRAMMFDNTRSKMGKFRPYVLTLGLPTAFLGILFVYLPYETMEYNQKLLSVFVVYTLLQFFSPFYLSAYAGLVQVMSANSNERSWIIEVSSIIYSFAPTVINPVIPLIGPMDNLKTYRIAFPVFCILGLAVSMICVFGTKERVIVPKRYVQKMGFFEGFKKVAKNKYFWIINVSGWIGFLSQGYSYLFQWVFYYGMNNKYIYSIMVILKGEASTPGMLLGAPLTNKLGKKRICLMSLGVQTLCLALMLFCYKNYILFFLLMFIKDMFGALSIIYMPSMKADVMDYQQYKTGDRIEGFIDQIGGMIGGGLALLTGYSIPLILRANGLTDNYDDLYNADFRNPIIRIMLICGLIGTALSIIPYFFYDLTEEKRAGMIKALKIRALFDDFIHGEVSDDVLISTVEEIHDAVQIFEKCNDDKDTKSSDYITAKIAAEEFKKYESAHREEWEKIEAKYELVCAK
ncbi:MAG: MFS transporter [Candidatus Fimenecus sp.]